MGKLSIFAETAFKAILAASLNNFRIATEIRISRSGDGLSASGQLMKSAADTVIRPMQITVAVLEPFVLGVMAFTNALSFFYERRRAGIPPADLIENAGSISITGKANLKHRVLQRIVLHAKTYLVAGIIAAGHYTWSSKWTEPTDTSIKVNLVAYDCTLKIDQIYRQFILIGEKSHLYNLSSNRFVRDMIQNSHLDTGLFEGVDPGPSDKSGGKVNISEMLLSFGMIPFAMGSGYEYAPAWRVAVDAGMQIHFLEFYDDAGYRRGLTKTTTFALGALGAMAIAYAPAIYFFSVPFRTMDAPLPMVGRVPKGMIEARNALMADEAFAFMKNHPQTRPFVAIGAYHVDGFLERLSRKGSLRVTALSGEKPSGF